MATNKDTLNARDRFCAHHRRLIEGFKFSVNHYLNLSLKDINGETWKDITSFEGCYQVSSFARIKSLERKAVQTNGHPFTIKERIMQQYTDKDGYLRVGIRINGKKKMLLVHRIVASVFIPNPHGKRFVNHKFGVKTDNRVSELEWCTQSENEIHAFATGLKRKPMTWLNKTGRHHSKSKQVKCDTLDILFGSISEAAAATGVGVHRITEIIHGRRLHFNGLVFSLSPNKA